MTTVENGLGLQDGNQAEPEAENIVESPMSKAQKRRLKKKRKRIEKSGKGSASDFYDVYGHDARASVNVTETCPKRIRIRDIQGLVLWALADSVNPTWIFIKNKPLVQKVLLVFASGLQLELLDKQPDLAKTLSTHFTKPIPSLALNSSIHPYSTINSILTIPHRKRRTYPSEMFAHEFGSGKAPPLPPKYYTLSIEQMKENGYTVPSNEAVEELAGFVHTRKSTSMEYHKDKAERLVAIDCEMCYSAKGQELTRVSIVNDVGEVLYDKLVKPSNPIVDYVTKYSGITAKMMEGVTTTLSDVQEEILEIIDSDTYIIGHSLENDLNALKLFHLNCIDTAILYPHGRGKPFKYSLKSLTERYLGKQIQQAAHDSTIDAKCAMELARLKIELGPNFGEYEVDGISICNILTKQKKYVSLVDRQEILRKHAVGSTNAVICTSDEDVTTKSIKEAKSLSANLVWSHLGKLFDTMEEELKANVCKLAPDPTTFTSETLKGTLEKLDSSFTESAKIQDEVRKMDERIGKMYEGLPSNAMMIVFSGQGNTSYVRYLQQLKWQINGRNSSPDSVWNDPCDEIMNKAMRQAAETVCYVGIKH